MIQLIKKGTSWKDWEVCFNGKSYLLSNDSSVAVDEGLYDFPVDRDLDIYLQDLKDLKFIDLPEELYIRLENSDYNLGRGVERVWIDRRFNKVMLYYCWGGEIEKWEDFLNPVLLRNEVFNILKDSSKNDSQLIVHDIDETDFGYIDLYLDYMLPIQSSISHTLKIIKNQIDAAYELAKSKIVHLDSSGSLVAKFSFDSILQNSCTRYLHFFIEFLKDMGMSADSNMKRHGSEVLFSITPTDKSTSLVKIKEALALYLNLPEFDLGNINIEELDPVTELKIEKISAEISRLKTDIKLNQAISKFENTLMPTSNIQDVSTIEVSVTKNAPLSGLKTVEIDNSVETKEEFLGGVIKLGVFKKMGVEFDWSNLVRRLRKK